MGEENGSGKILGYGSGEWIAACVLGLVLLIGYAACRGPEEKLHSDQANEQSTSNNTIGAWTYMKEFVRQRLKSPSTAEFPFGGHRDVTALGDKRYLVESYVDSQNSFGATLRTKFRGVIRETPNGWELESLAVDD